MKECPIVDPQLEQKLKEVCPKIVLASQSPNRRSVLEHAGLMVIAKPQDIVEVCNETEPAKVVMSLSRQKLDSYLNSADFDPDLVAIGIDTLVFLDGKLMGKPRDKSHAYSMISAFSGRWHEVFSGLSIYLPKTKEVTTLSDISRVKFAELSEQQITWYVETGDPMGAAGSYKIQSSGYKIIDEIQGSFSNIIGIPLERLIEKLS